MNYLPHTDEERKFMMDFIGIQSEEELFSSIPENLKDFQMDLPRPLSEMELVAEMKRVAAKNRTVDDRACFLGAGAYRHFIPSALEAIIS
ncbi:glycine dehydrogenase subunit 1, partial [Candidatus Hakubella thermalkaliphila]